MNLNAFIDPDGVSSLLPARTSLPLQYEGFNYLGAGLLVLCAAGIITAGMDGLKKIIPFIIPSMGLILLAVSQDAYFDLHPVYHFDLPDRIYSMLSVFRSSGRLVWPLYYLILFFSLYNISRFSGYRKLLTILAVLCAFLQIFDLHVFFLDTAHRFRGPANLIAEIPAELSGLVPDGSAHLYVSDGDPKTIDALGLFAADHHMSYNHMANAREIKHVFGGDKLDMNNLNCNMFRPDAVYLYIRPEDIPVPLYDCGGLSIKSIGEWKLFIPE